MTQSKSSPKKLNASKILGTIYDRFRRQAGWNLQSDETEEAKGDRMQFIGASLEVLGAARVPVAHYDRLYRRAMVARARKRANGESVNYLLSAEDLAVEWFVFEKEMAAIPNESEDLAVCPGESKHFGNEAVVSYCFAGEIDVVLPCAECRPKAFEQRKKEHLNEHNQSFASRRLGAADAETVKRVENETFNQQPEYFDLTNPVEILNRAKDAVSALMVKKIGTAEYDELRGAWKIIVNARRWVYEKDGI